MLVHHPYDSFSTSVQRFIEQAAADPNVLAIKQTLYRTSGDSPIVDALIDAAEAGKQVVALVEIKARFDEQANISWARELEKAGVHVVYGLVGLKTHCKTALVVRQEGRRSAATATSAPGNYNPKTARLYEDLGRADRRPDHRRRPDRPVQRRSPGIPARRTTAACWSRPYGVRRGIVPADRGGDRGTSAPAAGARVRLKMNSIVDEQVIDALYRASQAGVPVDVIVRGICALRPGVPGLSENIHVRSILGRFLEHSRVFHFGAADEYWIGSADMMHRNLDRRVEVLVRVADRALAGKLGDMLDSCLDPATRCWALHADGSGSRARPRSGISPVRDHQAEMMAVRSAATGADAE